MRETMIHKSAALGWSTAPTAVGLHILPMKGRQMGMRTLHRAWLAAMLADRPGAPRENLTLRAVRFALEHWHA